MTEPRTAGLRGLILDDRESGVLLTDHLSDEGLETPTGPFDYAKPVIASGGFPLALNATLGDCTIAGLIHLIQLLFSVIGQTFAYPGDDAVAALYWLLVGHGPTSPTDPGPGLQMLTVLDYITENGAFGVDFVGWAEIPVSNWSLIRTALYNFGALYLAVDLPQSAETDFAEHKLWTPSGSPIGGHCITGSGTEVLETYADVFAVKESEDTATEVADLELIDTETWGDETAFTEAWWHEYGAQAFVVIPQAFVTAGHGALANVNTASLEEACHIAAASRAA